jgi:adenosylhomocysteine nucleosidase
MIAITFALPAESSDFIRRIENASPNSREGVESFRGRLHGRSIVVIHTGVGRKICRERLEILLRRENFESLISAGFAGALEKDLRVGHLLVAENFSSQEFLGSAKLDLADETTFLGKLLTVPRMVETVADRESLQRKYGAAAVDMETEVVAELCAAHNLPMLSIRAISDTIAEPFPAPANVLFDVAKQKTDFVRLGAYFITHPSAFGRLNAFRKRVAVARKTLADALDRIVRTDVVSSRAA